MSVIERHEIVVVGAGPAGIRAAVEARAAGAEVLVLDDAPRPGGQIYRQLPPELAPGLGDPLGSSRRKSGPLLDDLQRAGAAVSSGTEVWGVQPERVLLLHHAGRARVVQASAVVLAAGAYDRPAAIPGWTLPGVVTAGGVTALVKAQRVLPGQRVLLAGTGPLLLAAATALVHGGAQVIGIAEAAPRTALLGLLRRPGIWSQTLEVGRTLWRTPVWTRTGLVRIEGTEGVERAILARIDGRGGPSPAPSAPSTSTPSSSATGWCPRPNWPTSPGARSPTTWAAADGSRSPIPSSSWRPRRPASSSRGTARGWAGPTSPRKRVGWPASAPRSSSASSPRPRRRHGQRRSSKGSGGSTRSDGASDASSPRGRALRAGHRRHDRLPVRGGLGRRGAGRHRGGRPTGGGGSRGHTRRDGPLSGPILRTDPDGAPRPLGRRPRRSGGPSPAPAPRPPRANPGARGPDPRRDPGPDEGGRAPVARPRGDLDDENVGYRRGESYVAAAMCGPAAPASHCGRRRRLGRRSSAAGTRRARLARSGRAYTRTRAPSTT